ncbi:hypothetical protein ESZ50_01905 [Weissella muntiaci]|uniref:Uncharacterized protein n=1 Tax=Weissella muntiaci TaxID=2508881 RepID=A0A6C2CAS7_9LACO|nr:hypothetical protein [Weissella muntiaci]TYC50716.1 hypothetical protein ESZ50_01905 [Weissella muntiaci]
MAKKNIVQVPDNDGNPAYALSHWKGINGKPFDENDTLIILSPDGNKWALAIDNKGVLKGVPVVDDNGSDGEENQQAK